MSDVRTPQPREKPQLFTFLLTLFTGLLALFTAALAFFTYLQVRALVDATKINERAWVTVKSAQFINLAVGQKPSATIIVENTGKSPATDFTVNSNISQLLGIQLQQGPMVLSQPPTRPSIGVLGPGMDFGTTIQFEHILTADEIESIKNGRLFLYGFGVIRYRDIFGIEHLTQYCFEPNLANINGPPSVCGQWNAVN